MSLVQFGTNIASIRKKTVGFYNRSGSAVTVYEGMPVCYMFDTTNNILGLNKATNVKGATTPEGYQNEGKFLTVELPYTDNLLWFAGVVAAGPWCNKSIATLATRWLDIYKPNGAIVPVRASVACTTGITILSLETDSQELTQPLSANQGRPVAISEETRALSDVADASISAFSDYSGTVAGTVRATSTHLLLAGTTGVKITATADYNGTHTVTYIDSTHFYFTGTFVATETGTMSKNIDIVLARLCPSEFIYQNHTGTALSVATSLGTSDIVVNSINVTSAQTSGRFTALEVKGAMTGTGAATGYGLALYVQADVTGVLSGETAGASFWMNLTGGTQVNEIYVVEVGLYESGANLASCERISPLCVRSQLDSTNTPSDGHYMITFICDGGGDHPDGLFACNEIQDIALTGASSVTVAGKIAFKVGPPGSEQTWYIPCGTAAG